MILTCPECATSYFVDDSRIPPEGRRVKCTSCGARWQAQREIDPLDELMEAAEPGPPPAPQPVAPATIPPDDLIISGPEEEPAPEPAVAEDTGLRKRPASAPPLGKSEPKPKGSPAVLWGGMAALVAALIAGAVVFREELVRVWPQSSAVFAGAGLDVPGGGLVIEDVKAEATFVSGRPALEITGAIRNLRGEAAEPPPLRVSLVNRGGKPVAAKTARAAGETIPAKARRYFAVAIVDPPADAQDLEVTFLAEETKAPAQPSHASEAAASPEHAPEDVKHAPAGTSEALADHG